MGTAVQSRLIYEDICVQRSSVPYPEIQLKTADIPLSNKSATCQQLHVSAEFVASRGRAERLPKCSADKQ